MRIFDARCSAPRFAALAALVCLSLLLPAACGNARSAAQDASRAGLGTGGDRGGGERGGGGEGTGLGTGGATQTGGTVGSTQTGGTAGGGSPSTGGLPGSGGTATIDAGPDDDQKCGTRACRSTEQCCMQGCHLCVPTSALCSRLVCGDSDGGYAAYPSDCFEVPSCTYSFCGGSYSSRKCMSCDLSFLGAPCEPVAINASGGSLFCCPK